MNKQMKILLGCVAMLCVLSGLVALVFMAPGKEEAVSGDEPMPLLAGKVDKVSVTNEQGEVLLTRQGEAFAVEGLEGLPLSENAAVLASQAGGLEAVREIVPADNLAQYGLDRPAATAAIDLAGETHTLKLGGEAPSSSGRYAELHGKVYLIRDEGLTAFAYGQEDYVSTQVTDILDAEETVEQITLMRENMPLIFTYVPETEAPEESTGSDEVSGTQSISGESGGDADAAQASEPLPAYYRLTTPVETDLDKYDVSVWANRAFGLIAREIEIIRPDAGQLAEYGLDSPETVLTVTSSSGETIKLSSSAPMEGICFLMRDDVPVIYRVSQADVPWRTVTVETLTHSVFGPLENSQIKTLTIRGMGLEYLFTRENSAILLNGKEAVEEEAFDKVIDAALRIPPEFLGETASPTLEPAVTITVSYMESGKSDDTLWLIPTGSGSLYLELNGETRYTAQESYAQALLEACEAAASPAASEH